MSGFRTAQAKPSTLPLWRISRLRSVNCQSSRRCIQSVRIGTTGFSRAKKDGWRFAANGYNLTDELNYDGSFGNRAVVAAGRTLMFSVGKKF